ncbi:sugar transferase [bacterium]|nr:sugar transferase [bacterium]
MVGRILKRSFDIVASATALALLSPLIGLISLLIRVTSPGPIFFRQERIGMHRKPFRMVKFRSMVVDADKLGPLVTARRDSRITMIGGILRRTKLDELPELWNVLTGDLSLVGPRPEVKKYVELYPPAWMRVFDVRPGITDFATLHFRDEESVLEKAKDREEAYVKIVMPIKIRLALWYIDHQSFVLDLRILVDTVLSITIGRFFPERFETSIASRAAEKVERLQ